MIRIGTRDIKEKVVQSPNTNTVVNPNKTCYKTILLTKTTTARYEFALSYHKVRGLYFTAVVFAVNILVLLNYVQNTKCTLHIFER